MAAVRNLVLILTAATLTGAPQASDIKIDVDLVTVACAVSTREGAPVRDLQARDFRLFDDGRPREIRNFWRESDLPLTVALVADVSGSQAGYIRSHREAVAQFLSKALGPRDRAMLVEIAQKAWLISGLSGRGSDIDASVEKIGTPEGKLVPVLGPPCRNPTVPHGCGGTALWHGLLYVVRELKPVTGRKAIIVLSDGVDTGSDVSLTDLIESAQTSGTIVYSVKYASPTRFLSIAGAIAQAVSHGLERVSRETGGLSFSNPGRNISEVFSKIETDLRNLYVLGFSLPEPDRDGRFHRLEVRTIQGGSVVRTRAGYRAPPD
jgi:Ca-activated chloride channel family protein